MSSTVVMQQFCNADDYDAGTQTCSAPYWGVAYGGLPPMTIEDATLVGGLIFSLWCTAWLIRPWFAALRPRNVT